MKKLMIAAAVAAAGIGVFAGDLCTIDPSSDCQAYDLTIKLKTLAPKTLKCKGGSACLGETKTCVSYYKNGKRTLKGIIWNCKSACDFDGAQYVIWRTDKGFQHVIGDYLTTETVVEGGKTVEKYKANDFKSAVGDEVYRYEKKANKVSMVWDFAGKEQVYAKDENGDMGWIDYAWRNVSDGAGGFNAETADFSDYDLKLAGLGSFDVKKGVVKNVSGSVAGSVTGDPTIRECDYHWAGLVGICDDFGAVCDDLTESAGSELLAAYGTWKLKYSKKIANGTKGVAAYMPAYAK
ncbi:MAG: hypothetical protein MJ240_00090 [Kiritimatiellae bacterium]|nr:hypothetical protein [Kiritimatiellia bacterium]